MLGRPSKSRNFFRKLVVNGVSSSKAAVQNDCLMRLYDADAELKAISGELDSFDGKKDPVRCNLLVNQLRTAQDKVISLLFQLMDDCNCERASRDYRMKFPDEILLSEGSESLNGQIWFGAECLSAGSNILNHTKESTMLRPMAKTLTTHLDSLRNDLRDLVTDGGGASRINQALIKKMVSFDHIFATFEYEYVRTMLPIRTVAEIEKLQEVAVLFSETLIDCVKRGLIQQDDIDEFQPIVMIAIPRLAIVRGLLYKNENPIYTRHKSQMCSLFQPFHGPLHSIRRLLRGLSPRELFSLEKMLANDQTAIESPLVLPKNESGAAASSNQQQDDSIQPGEEHASKEHSCGCAVDESEAGTSNNYSNVLMNELQSMMTVADATETVEEVDEQESVEPQPQKSSKAEGATADDEALLEELFMKQAQQLLHRLFVAISGVADQLQSNFASDLRFILRHIFSSEIEGSNEGSDDEEEQEEEEEEDSDNREYSNNEQSDSSLPIEQGIEAQEVANLIDLGSGYSINNPYECDETRYHIPQASSNYAYMNSTATTNTTSATNSSGDITRFSPSSSSLYASVTAPQSNESDTSDLRTFQDHTINQEVNGEFLAGLNGASDQSDLIYESTASPTEPSIMDNSRHHQQLVQQHLQSLTRGTRSSSSSSMRAHRHGQMGDSNSSQHGVERRSRHHGHGGSRSRRPRGPPVWVPDQLVVACSCCNASFTLFRRRHHCRACGQIFCAECSKFTKNLNCWGYNGPVRVCESCFNQP